MREVVKLKRGRKRQQKGDCVRDRGYVYRPISLEKPTNCTISRVFCFEMHSENEIVNFRKANQSKICGEVIFQHFPQILWRNVYMSCCSLMMSLNSSPNFSAALRHMIMRLRKISK